DYLVPSAAELPSFKLDHTITPSPTNPLGVKGIGEAGTIGSAPAVINAVVDALSPFGVTDVLMPATPERLWGLMQSAAAAAEVRESGDSVVVGALTCHADVEASELLLSEVPLLAAVAAQIGDPQVRHRGTIGGSIAHGDPASDLPAALLALRAVLVAVGPGG